MSQNCHLALPSGSDERGEGEFLARCRTLGSREVSKGALARSTGRWVWMPESCMVAHERYLSRRGMGEGWGESGGDRQGEWSCLALLPRRENLSKGRKEGSGLETKRRERALLKGGIHPVASLTASRANDVVLPPSPVAPNPILFPPRAASCWRLPLPALSLLSNALPDLQPDSPQKQCRARSACRPDL